MRETVQPPSDLNGELVAVQPDIASILFKRSQFILYTFLPVTWTCYTNIKVQKEVNQMPRSLEI